MSSGTMDLKKIISEKMQTFEQRKSVQDVMTIFQEILQTMYEDKETGTKFVPEDEDSKGYPQAETYMNTILTKLDIPVPMSKEELTEANKALKEQNVLLQNELE